MATKITIVKNYRNAETLKIVDLAELVSTIKTCEYEETIHTLRGFNLVGDIVSQEDGRMDDVTGLISKLPRICFSLELENRMKRRVRRGYTGLVLLEVNNLSCYDEAVAIRKGAGLMPQTLLAFVGASGQSVKIVCRGELFHNENGGGLPTDDDEVGRFHLNLYEKARLAYNAQLGVTIDKMEPHLERTCYIGSDQELVYNPAAVPFYTDTSELTEVLKPLQFKANPEDDVVPGHSRYHSMRLIYQYNLSKAYDDTMVIDNEEERSSLVLTRLASYCQETGLDMSFAQRQALFDLRIGKHPDVVRKTFENAYRVDSETAYRKKRNNVKPLKNIPSETLLAMKVEMFLTSNYELRKNVMRGVAEYRARTGLGFSFQDLTEEVRNSMTMQAMSQGIRCWDKDIRRFVASKDIELYDPMDDFLEHLPQWDGTDRVEPLARRITTDYQEWPHLFHIWMRSMVAMWKGKGQLTGNALVPILTGRQGCGKSSFCRILLPRDMREYYNDRINFKNEADLNLGLTSFALINLDEFDKITQRQQIVLKYLVSTSDLKYRPPYGKAYSNHRRYASFIGTTNEATPLVDPSGSRRFICVTVENNIDFETPIEYAQLYAQLKYEIEQQRERYYLTKEEERELMLHNLQYQAVNGLGEMLYALFEKPATAEEGQWMTIAEISARLKQTFRGAYQEDTGTFEKIGRLLSRPEYKFERERKTNGMAYWIKERA